MATTTNQEIERQARVQAKEHKKGDPAIRKVLWFPDDKEVRLVAVEDNLPLTLSGEVEPFYFEPSLKYDMPAWRALAIIRTDEVGGLKLPEGWGTWDDAVELEIEE
jgi:hypothetical protein